MQRARGEGSLHRRWRCQPLPLLLLGGIRSFYAGLDDNRVQRLRRSGVLLNKPRGRDTFSLLFESRIRLVPMNAVRDLYADVVPAVPKRTTSPHGDDEGRPAHSPYRVLIVDPIPLESVDEPISYPNIHPLLYQDWADVGKGPPCLMRGYAPPPELPAIESGQPPQDARAVASTLQSRAPLRRPEDFYFFYERRNRAQLRQYADTTVLRGSFTRDPRTSPATSEVGQRGEADDNCSAEFFLSVCADPYLDHMRFRREEAQVELISGYRNILYEAAELGTSSSGAKGRSSPSNGGVADVVRIPALACYSCGPRLLSGIAKLSQQSLLKGFHRLGNDAKEALLSNRRFTVELFTPSSLHEEFVKAFAEEAWEVPASVLQPGRRALYPGLAPPRTLLTYDGWTGKRRELIDAVETAGLSLLRGPQYGIDGREITEQEVHTQIRMFGSREAERKRLAEESATARPALEVEAEEQMTEGGGDSENGLYRTQVAEE